jgi:hypothetical protein
VRSVDVSDPSNPVEVEHYNTEGSARKVTLQGDYAYIADEYGGLCVLDVSDPLNFIEVSVFDTPGPAYDVDVAGNYAYVSANYDGLQILDISDPANITEVSFFPDYEHIWGITVHDGYAYLAAYWEGLHVLDVSHPNNPIEVGYYDGGTIVLDLFIHEGYIYLAEDKFMGIYQCEYLLNVLEHEKVIFPVAYELFPVYPNPFNPSTVISYQLPMISQVSLEIYDIHGRLIESPLHNALREAGYHEVTLLATNLTSGIYFIRLSAGTYNDTRKLVLLK